MKACLRNGRSYSDEHNPANVQKWGNMLTSQETKLLNLDTMQKKQFYCANLIISHAHIKSLKQSRIQDMETVSLLIMGEPIQCFLLPVFTRKIPLAVFITEIKYNGG